MKHVILGAGPAGVIAAKSTPRACARSWKPSSIQRTKLAWKTIRAGSQSFQWTGTRRM